MIQQSFQTFLTPIKLINYQIYTQIFKCYSSPLLTGKFIFGDVSSYHYVYVRIFHAEYKKQQTIKIELNQNFPKTKPKVLLIRPIFNSNFFDLIDNNKSTICIEQIIFQSYQYLQEIYAAQIYQNPQTIKQSKSLITIVPYQYDQKIQQQYTQKVLKQYSKYMSYQKLIIQKKSYNSMTQTRPDLMIQKPQIQEAQIQKPEVQQPQIYKHQIQQPSIFQHQIQQSQIYNPYVQQPIIHKPQVQQPLIQKSFIQRKYLINASSSKSYDGQLTQTKNLNRHFRSKLREVHRDLLKLNPNQQNSKIIQSIFQPNRVGFQDIKKALTNQWFSNEVLKQMKNGQFLNKIMRGMMGIKSKKLMIKYYHVMVAAAIQPQSFLRWKYE